MRDLAAVAVLVWEVCLFVVAHRAKTGTGRDSQNQNIGRENKKTRFNTIVIVF